MRFYKMILILLTAFAVTLACTGCGGGGGGGTSDTTAPVVTNGKSEPPTGFDFQGGAVTLLADATDSSGIKQIKATVSNLDGSTILLNDVAMIKKTGDTYQLICNFPANAGNVAQKWQVKVTAGDAAGNMSAAYVFTFDVPTAGSPPAPPVI